ncbi:short-chain dehydrogenase [Aeromicrobium sp. Root236]|uniref:SDR family oxidoreductase n=1 Tax=Aeromicrobium sp. Root236 TaxID=1736498 RepID=UPI0006F3242C|nr:SDR family oxidoreductase [Aeromicrobium sp. Root236]KRC65017.1 short-chain dehydrogenase [Aeromicrobium sp. Root236]
MTSLADQTVLVTGANRGMGKEYVRQLLERGAKKVYASARDASTIDTTDPRVVALQLDVTDATSVDAAVAATPDVTVLINNAGTVGGGPLLTGDQTVLRQEFETNYFGPLRLASLLADRIADNGNGVILNVHSALSWVSFGGTYEPTKAALWSATNGLRLALAPRGVQVVGLHVGYVDTDMVAGVDAPKSDPADVVKSALDGIEAGAFEVLADDVSHQAKAALGMPIEAVYPQVA